MPKFRRSNILWRLNGRGAVEAERQRLAEVSYALVASQQGAELSVLGTLRVLGGEWHLPVGVELSLLLERDRVATVVIQSGNPFSGEYAIHVRHPDLSSLASPRKIDPA